MHPQSTIFPGVHNLLIDQLKITYIAGNYYKAAVKARENLVNRLNPILDAAHTRNLENSPPDSECHPETRKEVINEITEWADAMTPVGEDSESEETPCASGHSMGPVSSFNSANSDQEDSSGNSRYMETYIYWLHGFAGCGKSAVSLEVAKIRAKSGRLLASYFFSHGAGYRSTMNRFATTLASQLAVTIPATAQFIDAAITVQPGLLTGDLSLGTQMDLLILFPFLAVVEEGAVEVTLNKPFLLVIDGLDECEDKRGVKEFIRHIQNFFREHPDVPLKVFIASRADQHIQELLETDTGVWLGNLNSHWQGKDIERFLEYSFQDAV